MNEMSELKLTSKIFLYICFLSGLLWLGSYVARLTLTYQLFEGNNFALKSIFNSHNLTGIFITLNSAAILTSILFTIFIISFIFFLVFSRINLRENGWLLISTIIIILTIPFEIILMNNDYKIYTLIQSGNFDPNQVLLYTINRFKILGSFPIIEVLCYFSIIYLIIFKPLKLVKN